MSDEDSKYLDAKAEIDKSLVLGTYCMRQFGLTFVPPKNSYVYFRDKVMLIISFMCILYHISSEIIFIAITLASSPKVEEIVPLFHTFGYGALSIVKLFALWSKREAFEQLLRDLVTIWPMPPMEPAAQKIKDNSLAALKFVHLCYFVTNLAGLWFYNLTPIVVYFYETYQGLDAKFGFIWTSWYPFDKYSTVGHTVVYIFEIFAGVTCVWAMIGTDLLFTAVASHVCMLLRLLHQRLQTLAPEGPQDDEANYHHIVENIKLHQRLIKYCMELENAFTFVNLVNIVFSSVNICCVVFVIVLLEPLLVVSSKLFLASCLVQIGIICWYSDDIFHANADVGLHAYNSGWFRTEPKCRKILVFLIKRSQKPIALTAMKFTNMNLMTYSAILTRSYSYFALLYTMFNDNVSAGK
uniref:Odorant receptor n=1 Tax=Conopomorpha sinensis TaxID=940481 RepID=A0A3S7SGL9_9NEOP|nr:putative odorant receptor 15 [Conopomorpha sinensis]